jgi:hypothetical protein
MRKYLPLILVLALLLPVVGKAQVRGRNNRDDRSERIAQVIRDCEQRTNEFLKAVGSAWGRDRHNNDMLDRNATRLERALNRVRDSWNRDHDYARTRGNIGAALSAGRDVNRTLSSHRLNQRVSREWGAIRTELDNLANVFGQPRIRW